MVSYEVDFKEIGWGSVDFLYLAQERNKWSLWCEHSNEQVEPVV
jgi:hypothetical protein